MTVLWGSIWTTNGKIDRDELVRGQKDEVGMMKAIEGGAARGEKQISSGNDKQERKGNYGDSDSSHPSERSSPGTPASSQNDGR